MSSATYAVRQRVQVSDDEGVYFTAVIDSLTETHASVTYVSNRIGSIEMAAQEGDVSLDRLRFLPEPPEEEYDYSEGSFCQAYLSDGGWHEGKIVKIVEGPRGPEFSFQEEGVEEVEEGLLESDLLPPYDSLEPSTRVSKMTPLMVACEGARLDEVKALIAAGADPNERGEAGGQNAMMCALKGDNTESGAIVSALAAAGFDVKSKPGCTDMPPFISYLFLAAVDPTGVKRGVIKALVDAGASADPVVQDESEAPVALSTFVANIYGLPPTSELLELLRKSETGGGGTATGDAASESSASASS